MPECFQSDELTLISNGNRSSGKCALFDSGSQFGEGALESLLLLA
jgi:hypothetical protein